MTNEEILLQAILEQPSVQKEITYLDLSEKGLTVLPPAIGQLSHLTELKLWGNELTELPPEIAQLTQLRKLNLARNKLRILPSEIAELTHLKILQLGHNPLSHFPPEIAQLTALTELLLNDTQLTSLPPEIGQLRQLIELSLSGSQLISLPAEIGQLTHLRELTCSRNQLTHLPAEIGQLTHLTTLSIEVNQLTRLPPEIGQLSHLKRLNIGVNKLKELPPEIGQLSQLEWIELSRNPINYPPFAIVAQGTKAILGYLQAQLKEQQKQWLSKLIVVGEGGVGKTSLLRVLRGETFNSEESTTHGIETKILKMPHPSEDEVIMQLNTWDFGGQEIYHATHQFFLTNRSLFLLAWQARLGFEASKLYYWLDTLTALAPDSPVLLVATHIDERDTDLPFAELCQRYPQIMGECEISSKTGQGIEVLRESIRQAAAKLPLMGEIWPSTWLKAANAIRASTENEITPQALRKLMTEHGIDRSQQPSLIQWLHDLGDILFFQDNDELDDIVILNPQWLSEYISQVLESEDVINKGGVFSRAEMKRLWHDLTPTMREHFLRLMERFDLSYRDESREISLVVERLPHTPPDYQSKWDGIKAIEHCKEIKITFKLNTLPSGIPTWLIARVHRFSTNTHWRNGALFAYDNHLALVQTFPQDNALELSVRGPNPQNFFALLKDGLELTLARFPGLKIKRKIPCLGHHGEFCSHEFDYEQLQKRKKTTIECPQTEEEVSVTELLYGWDSRTQNDVLARLDKLGKGQNQILAGQNKVLTPEGHYFWLCDYHARAYQNNWKLK
jgi:internalin A